MALPPRDKIRIAVVGLGYVGLPLAVYLSRHFPVVGFDIDPSRIETRTGNAGTATSEHWIIPAGATFPAADTTTPVDEAKVKAIPDHPKPVAKKKAAKKAE